MKQWQFTKSGTPREVLKMVEVPIPTSCADNEVLVRISHISFNSAIAHKLIGHYAFMDPVGAVLGRPVVPEMDFSGVVCDLKGKLAQHLVTGERVFGLSPPWFLDCHNGVLREYVLAKYDHITRIPDNVSFKDASCLGATGITVHYIMKERSPVKEGDRIFITGASGAVGVMAVQLAKKLVGGAGLVVASAGTSKLAAIKELGADEVVDYTKCNMPDYLRQHYSDNPFDMIIDIVGNDHSLYSNSPAYLTPNGTYYTVGLEFGDTAWTATKRVLQFISAMALPTYLGGVPRTHIFESTKVKPSRLIGVANMAEDSTLKVVVDSVFAFDEVHSAYDRVMSHKAIGKVVVQIANLDK